MQCFKLKILLLAVLSFFGTKGETNTSPIEESLHASRKLINPSQNKAFIDYKEHLLAYQNTKFLDEKNPHLCKLIINMKNLYDSMTIEENATNQVEYSLVIKKIKTLSERCQEAYYIKTNYKDFAKKYQEIQKLNTKYIKHTIKKQCEKMTNDLYKKAYCQEPYSYDDLINLYIINQSKTGIPIDESKYPRLRVQRSIIMTYPDKEMKSLLIKMDKHFVNDSAQFEEYFQKLTKNLDQAKRKELEKYKKALSLSKEPSPERKPDEQPKPAGKCETKMNPLWKASEDVTRLLQKNETESLKKELNQKVEEWMQEYKNLNSYYKLNKDRDQKIKSNKPKENTSSPIKLALPLMMPELDKNYH
jgi:hypothetical protein